jgi:hypothetical protein
VVGDDTVNKVDLHLPDTMGVWEDDGGRVWLPKEYYPTQADARRFMMEYCDTTYIEPRVLSRHMKYQPRVEGIFIEDWWVVCDADDEAAFPVWECE